MKINLCNLQSLKNSSLSEQDSQNKSYIWILLIEISKPKSIDQMEEMMKKSTEAMGNNQNGVVGKSKVENPNADHMEIDNVMMEDDAALEVINFSRRFPKCIGTFFKPRHCPF